MVGFIQLKYFDFSRKSGFHRAKSDRDNAPVPFERLDDFDLLTPGRLADCSGLSEVPDPFPGAW
jgi:hypothetical protein